MRIYDISPLIDASIGVWPGDTPFAHNVNLDIANGDNITLSDIRSTLHVGAHGDAPSHYVKGGADIASRSLDFYFGECQLIEVHVERGARIMPHDLHVALTAKRVLLRTKTFRSHHDWNYDFASLSPELVEFAHEHGVITIGLDTPSVDPFNDKILEAHQALARCDMANLEGLVLHDVPEGTYELVALPLKIKGADASPVRAVLVLR